MDALPVLRTPKNGVWQGAPNRGVGGGAHGVSGADQVYPETPGL